MSANLLELQEMLRNLDMGSVQRVAQGQSGKAAQLLGMDEIRRRREQMQEAQANEAEQQMQQPPMVDQYLAMSQQMQGIGSIPGAPYGPMSGGDPRAGYGHGMPPQMKQMAPAQPPQQMPPRTFAGGGPVGGSDLMNRPKMGNMGIVEYLVSTGMSREEAMAMADSIVGGGQSNALKAGGFIQKYAPGGSVASGPISDLTPEEQEAAADPGFIQESIEWVKENPVDAAILGIDTAALAAMAFPVAGWAAGAGLKGVAGAARIARALGPKAIRFLRNPVQTAGKARFSKTASKIDDLAAPPMASSAEVSAARAAQMEARLNAPGAMRTTIRDGKVVQVPRTDAELITTLGRRAVYPAVGAATYGLTSLIGDDEGAPQEFTALTDEEMGFKPPAETEDKPQTGAPASGENGNNGDTGNGETALGFLDRVKGGEFNPFFQFLTRAGLELAAGKGENLGQDIAQAGIAGMGEVERLADRDMAIADREREQARQDAADAIAQSQLAIAQRKLQMEEELLPAQKALLESRASGFGTTSASAAQSQIENAIESVFGINYLSNPDAQLEQTRLLNIYTSQGPQALRQAIADLTGQSIAIDTVNQDKLNRILNPGVAGG